MSISYNYAMRFVGKPVMAYCHGGRRHYGIMQRVTPQSIHLMPIPYRGRPVSSNYDELDVTTANQQKVNEFEVEESGYVGRYPGGFARGYPGYSALGAGVVLPLYVLLAISLFWW